MERISIRKLCAISAGLAFAASSSADNHAPHHSYSYSWIYNAPPKIKNVTIDQSIGKITIVGSGLLRGNGDVPYVRLLDNPNIVLQNCEADATTPNRIIVCDLPDLDATDYELRVSDGRRLDSYALTISTGGAQGPQGETGPQGPAGETGGQGPAGPDGPAGETGPQGPAGLVGPAGAIGATGPAGPAGPVGPAGAVGATGAAGPVGPAGAVGETGPVGPAGAAGAIGPVGPAGPAGATGVAGPAGAQGPAGPQGESGDSILQTLANDGVECPVGSLLRLLADDDGSANWRCISPSELRSILAGSTVFVTSERYTGDLVTEANTLLGTSFDTTQGLSAGDALCQSHADSASLSGTFVAWLSTLPNGSNNAGTRIGENASGYVLADKTTFIAEDKSDLLDGTLAAPIGLDETGTPVSTGGLDWTVWTNTGFNGNEGSGGGFNCQGYTSSISAELGVVGDARAVGNGGPAPQGSWTRANNLPCNQRARLFCFQR